MEEKKVYVLKMNWSIDDDTDNVEILGVYTDLELAKKYLREQVEYEKKTSWIKNHLCEDDEENEDLEIDERDDYFDCWFIDTDYNTTISITETIMNTKPTKHSGYENCSC